MGRFAFRIDFADAANIPDTKTLTAIMREASHVGEITSLTLSEASDIKANAKTADLFRDGPALYFIVAGEKDTPFSALKTLMEKSGALQSSHPHAYANLSL